MNLIQFLEDPNLLTALLLLLLALTCIDLCGNALPEIRSLFQSYLCCSRPALRFDFHDRSRIKRIRKLRSWIIVMNNLREKMSRISMDEFCPSSKSIREDMKSMELVCEEIRLCLNEAEENARRSRQCFEQCLRVFRDDSLEIARFLETGAHVGRFMGQVRRSPHEAT